MIVTGSLDDVGMLDELRGMVWKDTHHLIQIFGGLKEIGRIRSKKLSRVLQPAPADLIYKKACRGTNSARIPVQGIKEVVIGDETHIVDFGEGECDSIVTITANGETTEVDLSDRK